MYRIPGITTFAMILAAAAMLNSGCEPQTAIKAEVQKRLQIRRLEPIWDFYTGALIEITGPGENVFWLWPEEYWSWISADGQRHGGFAKAEFIRDFQQDEHSGIIRYKLAMAPEECDISVRITPRKDVLVIEHEIDNRGRGTVIGGSPCLQIGRARDFQTWNFDQAKRAFLWTRQGGFTWVSDTRRSGRDAHLSNKLFCQNYHFRDPEKMHKAFGRSPDLAASSLIGAVSINGKWLVACVSENADSVAYGLMNCLHSSHTCPTPPSQKRVFVYRIYFLENDLNELVRRARLDFPELSFPPPDMDRVVLASPIPPLESFEDRKSYARVRLEKARMESMWVRRLSVEQGAAPSFGVTHGRGAALCELEDGGKITIPALFTPTPANRFFTADLTVPVDRDIFVRICLRQAENEVSDTFELIPGTPRRCVVPLKGVSAGRTVDLIVEAADQKACLLQIDALTVY
ncbi:MAG TPA: hypothetical protein PLP42_04200 [Acidobacteriota bacterium]|nr:hypothetical protein [Acidobacteriota bacterium]